MAKERNVKKETQTTTARKRRRKVTSVKAKVMVKSTLNNTIVTLTDETGSTVAWASAGTVGFKGSKKGTAYAAQLAAESVANQALDAGVKRVDVFVKGPGAGRESSVRGLQGGGLMLDTIKDLTPIPHNGCRPKKRRRV